MEEQDSQRAPELEISEAACTITTLYLYYQMLSPDHSSISLPHGMLLVFLSVTHAMARALILFFAMFIITKKRNII